MRDLSVLDNIIVGRVDPHVYAFTTDSLPNCLKIGDTYRPVSVRLREWREHYPDLEEQFVAVAKVDEEVYFRDHAVHHYLERDKRKKRLQRADFPKGMHYSKEFFRSAEVQDVEDAIAEIKRDYDDGGGGFRFYSADTRLPETHTYKRVDDYEPRPNQQATIIAFKDAVEAGHTNLLMYAVMRFGKSFTSMCCALEMDAKMVVAVSAKADVREEWKKTVQSHVKFKDFDFIDGDALRSDENAVRAALASGRRAFVFLTLQDLQGDLIKEKHREVFGNDIDLLIVDETHFGARAEKYGAVLREREVQDEPEVVSREEKLTLDDFVQPTKALSAKVQLHLSGTPYRILMGSEFKKDDIVAFYQFADIVKDQEEWIADNDRQGEPKEEWENPYYGFPQMIRFAFHPNESSRKRLEELKKSGASYAFSALFEPQSIKKAHDGGHKRFKYEQEVLEFLEVIDGSKDDGELLGFLDYEKIQEGEMCQHIVCVLPYRASCDALEALIKDNPDKFKHLNEYEIINISGVDNPTKYRDPADIKSAIRSCELSHRKTITLTVRRMLTGSTVEEWDTMLFLRDTASPQEYDQAVFRLQSQYVKTLVDAEGDTIKRNMKPQTLLVDFDPDRMFVMEEQKAQIYNVHADEAGNAKLQERLSEELRISPIVRMNADKMEQVEAKDILGAISRYSRNKGVAEEATEIPVDLALKDIEAIWEVIGKENELGSRSGFVSDAHQGAGEGSDIDAGDQRDDKDFVDDECDGAESTDGGESGSQDKERNPVKQFQAYYARMLFYAFLTKDEVASLEDIIATMGIGDNRRIARNVGIHKPVLEILLTNMDRFVLRDLDYKILNLNKLSRDPALEPLERASIVVQKIGKLGEAEVIAPAFICADMVETLSDERLTALVSNGHKILDLSSKVGEFAIALCDRYERMGYPVAKIKDLIYAIPTSPLTYEFTRKVYEALGLDVTNIAERFTSYDLLNVATEDGEIDYGRIVKMLTQGNSFNSLALDEMPDDEGDETVVFDAIVGNPPYHAMDGGAQKSAGPIYDRFVEIAKSIDPLHMVMIIPARWYAGGKGDKLKEFRQEMLADQHIIELHDFMHPEEVFPETNNRGGVCYFARSKDYDNSNALVEVVTHYGEGKEPSRNRRSLRTGDLDIFVRDSKGLEILEKVQDESTNSIGEYISAAKAFGFRTYFIDDPRFRDREDGLEDSITCFGRGGKRGYVDRSEVLSHAEWIDSWKVYVPESNNIGTELRDDNQNSFVGKPKTVCTETFLVVGAELGLDETAANNLASYLRTKFARFMLSLAKSGQHATAKAYRFVPLQDFSRSWTDADLYAKYHLTAEDIDHIEATIQSME